MPVSQGVDLHRPPGCPRACTLGSAPKARSLCVCSANLLSPPLGVPFTEERREGGGDEFSRAQLGAVLAVSCFPSEWCLESSRPADSLALCSSFSACLQTGERGPACPQRLSAGDRPFTLKPAVSPAAGRGCCILSRVGQLLLRAAVALVPGLCLRGRAVHLPASCTRLAGSCWSYVRVSENQ